MKYGSLSYNKFILFKFYQLRFLLKPLFAQGHEMKWKILNVYNHALSHPNFVIKHL